MNLGKIPSALCLALLSGCVFETSSDLVETFQINGETVEVFKHSETDTVSKEVRVVDYSIRIGDRIYPCKSPTVESCRETARRAVPMPKPAAKDPSSTPTQTKPRGEH